MSDHRNRDYAARPHQASGRSSHDYGRTDLRPTIGGFYAPAWIWGAPAALIGLAVLLCG